jgi:DNA topoisomerase VI subunit A
VVTQNGTIINGTSTALSVNGLLITQEWIANEENFSFHLLNAICILVIEKEGIYLCLSESYFYEDFSCILV